MFNYSRIRIALFVAILLGLSVWLYFFNHGYEIPFNQQGGTSYINYERAVVVDVKEEILEADPKIAGLYRGTQDIDVKILSGEHKGEILPIKNYLSTLFHVYTKKGTKLIVSVDTAGPGHYEARVFNYNRETILYCMIGLFFAALWAIGGRKGLQSIVGIVFTFALIVFMFIPMVFRGYSPITISMLLVILSIIITMFVLNGWGSKSLSALLGTSLGVLIAGVFAYIAGQLIHVTGFNTKEVETLILIGNETGMNVKGLLFAGVLIASLGAIMDVGISIASSIYEVYVTNKTSSKKGLFMVGIHVGRDMMGTMAMTLILAFTGSTLTALMLLYSYNVPYHQLVNMDIISIEVMQGIAGSIGVFLTVPAVAIVSAYLMPWFDKQHEVKPALDLSNEDLSI